MVIIVAILFNSRAFILGGLTAVFFHFYIIKPIIINRKIVVFFTLLLIAILFALAFLIKTDSTLSRIFIYKISFNILKDNYLYGIGPGNFKHTYLDYQATYFSLGNYTDKELLLAGNTYYAFNDYYQFIIETGLPGFFLLLISIYLISILIKNNIKSSSLWAKISISVLIITSVAATFTHVFENLFFQILFILSLITLIVNSILKYYKKIVSISGIIIITLLITRQYAFYAINYRDYIKIEDAEELYSLGFYTESNEKLKALYPIWKADIDFLLLFADVNFRLKNYQLSIFGYKQVLKLKKHNLYYLKLANCYNEINDNDAVYYYQRAINCVPNRFLPRYSLFNYYMKTGELNKGIKEGKEILSIPVKIPSETVSRIKKNVKGKINKIIGINKSLQ